MLGLLRVVNSVAGKHRGIMLAVLQHKTIFMTNQKDRHLEAPGEANRDKHINFLAVENGDADPASEDVDENDSEDTEGVDNGFFTDDDKNFKHKKNTKKMKAIVSIGAER